jgi:dephospho-CoA kinase
MPAKDVIDLQLGVDSLADADRIRDALADAGFPARPDIDHDRPKPPGGDRWPKRYHGGADPGRRVHLHVRVVGSPGWRYALLVRDWLRADPDAREEYLAVKRSAVAAAGGDIACYAGGKEPWFDTASPRAENWAVTSGWVPSLA